MNPQPSEPELPESLRRLLKRRRTEGTCPTPSDAAAFVEGTLDGEARTAFLAHLGACRTCACEVQELREVLAASARGPRRPAERTTVRPRNGQQRPSGPTWAWVAAAAGVVVALTLFFARGDDPEPPAQVAKGPAEPTRPAVPPTPETPKGPSPPESPETEPPKDPLEGELDPPKPPTKDPEVVEAPMPPPDPPRERTAPRGTEVEVASIAGAPEVRQAGEADWRALPPGQSVIVPSGNVAIRAGSSHAARVTLAGCVVSAEKTTEMTLARDTSGLRLALERGGLLVDSSDRFSEPIAIQVAGALVDGPRLRCAVRLSGADADVLALDGEVTITSGGRPVGVPTGHASRVSRGQVATSPRPGDVGAFLAWTREVEVYLPVEAESGKLEPNVATARDAKAGGGQYVLSPRQKTKNGALFFEVTIDVERDAEYRVLARVAPGDYKSTKGKFQFQFDGEKRRYLQVIGGGDEWQWSELEDTVRLTKGRHTIRIADPWGGHWIDSVLATTDPWYRPTEEGGRRK